MDRHSQYNWDRHNKGHIAAHQVEPHEFEEVLANEPIYIETRIDTQSGEERILELGHTNRGRVLFVAWTPRGERIRPVTAFEANRKTRNAYEKLATRMKKLATRMRGDAMKKNSSKATEAEAAFAADLYRNRAALNGKAQKLLAAGSRQVTIRLGNNEIARAKQQAEAKGLRYQTYIKMLLHEALERNLIRSLRPIKPRGKPGQHPHSPDRPEDRDARKKIPSAIRPTKSRMSAEPTRSEITRS